MIMLFKSCESLKSVVFLSKSIKIYELVFFYNCTNLRSVVFYGNITILRPDAFKNCTSLSTFFYYGTYNLGVLCSGVFKSVLFDAVNVTKSYKADKFCNYPVRIFEIPTSMFSKSSPFSFSGIFSSSSEFSPTLKFSHSSEFSGSQFSTPSYEFFSPSLEFVASKKFDIGDTTTSSNSEVFEKGPSTGKHKKKDNNSVKSTVCLGIILGEFLLIVILSAVILILLIKNHKKIRNF